MAICRKTPKTKMLNRGIRFFTRKSYLRFGARDRVARAFLNPDNNKGERFEIADFNGIRYSGNLDNFIDWSAYFYGAYEKYLLDGIYLPLIKSSAKPIFLDVGGNIGHHSLYVANECHAIHAFEPDQGCQKEFWRKLEISGTGNITIHGFALGRRDAKGILHSSVTNNKGTNSLFANYNPSANTLESEVSIKNGDKFIDALQLPSIALIKIDVEGYEVEVLRGLPSTLSTYRPPLIIEISEETRSQLKSEEVSINNLLPSNYEFFAVDISPFLTIFEKFYISRIEGSDLENFTGNLLCLPKEKHLSTCLPAMK